MWITYQHRKMAYFKQKMEIKKIYPQVIHTKSTSYPQNVDNVDNFFNMWITVKIANFLDKIKGFA